MSSAKCIYVYNTADTTFLFLNFLKHLNRLLHELDVELLVAEWEKTRHFLAITANNAASLVLTRMGTMKSKGFMLKKSS